VTSGIQLALKIEALGGEPTTEAKAQRRPVGY
jgi:hypothetical protein